MNDAGENGFVEKIDDISGDGLHKKGERDQRIRVCSLITNP